jgi:chemotaxis protein methyltransferase CheR
MILNNFLPLDRIKIIATDIDMEAIRKAKEGFYTPKSIEALPDYYTRRFFRKIGGKYAITDEVKKCVEFKRLDLLQDKYPDNCDLIICRNVLIYFTREAKDMVYYKIAESLKREGILFVGSTEQIIMSQKYGLRPIRTFFYTKEQNTFN